MLGVDPNKRKKKQARKKLLESFPRRALRKGEADASLTAWLLNALSSGGSLDYPVDRLAESLTKNHEKFVPSILQLDPKTFGTERVDRTRLRKLQALLSGQPDDPLIEVDLVPFSSDPKPRPVQADHEFMLTAIRPLTEGKRALLVTNRPDEGLKQTLIQTFAFKSLRLVESSPSKIASCKQSISRGTVDIVILATGFQSHAVERAIKPAARAAKIPYISAYRARRLDCMRAMMRDLGLSAPTTGS